MHWMAGSCWDKATSVGWHLHILTLMGTTAWEKSSWLNSSGLLARVGEVKHFKCFFLIRKTSAEDIRLIIRRYEKDFDICGYHQTLKDLRTLLKIKTRATKSRWHFQDSRQRVNRESFWPYNNQVYQMFFGNIFTGNLATVLPIIWLWGNTAELKSTFPQLLRVFPLH